MATTPQDHKKPQPRKKTTSASQWKKTTGHEVEVPSGNTALVRRQGMQTFLKKGVIPNSLMPLVQKAINDGEFDTKEMLESLDLDKLEELIQLYDVIVIECVIEPQVSAIPRDDAGNGIPLAERDQDKLYVDEVDFEDKQFIFQWVVGGTADVEQFRQQQSAAMDALSASNQVVAPAVNDSGSDG